MAKLATVCLFCEDIREERSGQDTIVGTMPDNLVAEGQRPSATAKAMLPKLGIYLRINFDIDGGMPKSVKAEVYLTNGAKFAESAWAPEVVEKAFSDTRANQLPLVGLVFKLVAGHLPLGDGGKIKVVVTVDDAEYLAGALNVIVSSVLQPPALPPPTAP